MELKDFSKPENIRLAKFPDIDLAQKPSRKVWEAYKKKLEENGNEKPWLGDLIKMLVLFSHKLDSDNKETIINTCNAAFDSNWEGFNQDFDQNNLGFKFYQVGNTLRKCYPIKIDCIGYEEMLLWVLENFVTRETEQEQQPYGKSWQAINKQGDLYNNAEDTACYFYLYINSYIPHLLMKYMVSKIMVMTGKEVEINIPELDNNPLSRLPKDYKAYVEALMRNFRVNHKLPELSQDAEITLSDEEFEQLRHFYDENGDKLVSLVDNSIRLYGRVPKGSNAEENKKTYEKLYREYIKARYESTSRNTEQDYITSLLVDYIITDFFASHEYFDLSYNNEDVRSSTTTRAYYITEFTVTSKGLKKYFEMIYGEKFEEDPKLYSSVWPGIHKKLEQFCYDWQIPFRFNQLEKDEETIVMGSNSFDLETRIPGIQYYANADNFKKIYELLQKRQRLIDASYCGEDWWGIIDPLGPIKNAIRKIGFMRLLDCDLTTIDPAILDSYKSITASFTLCVPHYNEYADKARMNYLCAFLENIPGVVIGEKNCVTSGGYGPLHQARPISQTTTLEVSRVNLLRLIQLYKEEEARLKAATDNAKQNKEDERTLGIKPNKPQM